MPVVAKGITGAILTAGPLLSGPEWLKVATAVGNAVAKWAVVPSNVTLNGLTAGTMGAGVPVGKFFMSPDPNPVVSSCAGVTLIGFDTPQVATAVGTGVGTYMNSAGAYQGTASAYGSDTTKVSATDPSTLIGLITVEFTAMGLSGGDYGLLASGLGTGIALMFLTGTGTGAAPGASPSPGSGPSLSKLV